MNYYIKNSISFDDTTSITGKLEGIDTTKYVEIAVPLNYLCNSWGTLDMSLINCEISLILIWSANCVLTNKATTEAKPNANPAVVEINNPANATFKIRDTKVYVPVVTLSTQDDNKLLEQLKTGFKRTIKCNRYRSEMTNQVKVKKN